MDNPFTQGICCSNCKVVRIVLFCELSYPAAGSIALSVFT